MDRINFWQGERIRLRAVEPSDGDRFHAWNEDSDMARFLDFVWPARSLESARQWAQREAARVPENDAFSFVIETVEGEFAGMISTHSCDRRVGSFKYGVAINREQQRKGYAHEAILMVVRYFFDELRYQKVTVDIHEDNPASTRLHERLGFQLEGRIRRIVFNHGQYFDGLLYGMTVEEFHEKYPSA